MIFRQMYQMTPKMTPKVSMSKVPIPTSYASDAQFFVCLTLWSLTNSFELWPNFWEKCSEWLPNDLDMLKVKSYPNLYLRCPQGASFCPFCSMMSHFQVTAHFFGKVHQMTPKMTRTCSRSKVPIRIQHTGPKAKIFIHFALRWAIFELWSNVEKSALNDFKTTLTCTCSRSNVHTCIPFTYI